jgi:hypothetical protein
MTINFTGTMPNGFRQQPIEKLDENRVSHKERYELVFLEILNIKK